MLVFPLLIIKYFDSKSVDWPQGKHIATWEHLDTTIAKYWSKFSIFISIGRTYFESEFGFWKKKFTKIKHIKPYQIYFTQNRQFLTLKFPMFSMKFHETFIGCWCDWPILFKSRLASEDDDHSHLWFRALKCRLLHWYLVNLREKHFLHQSLKTFWN